VYVNASLSAKYSLRLAVKDSCHNEGAGRDALSHEGRVRVPLR
jgi:hypothetical protein